MWCAVNSCINHSFFNFIFAFLLRFCSCSVTLFMVRSTWYGVRGPHHFWGAPVTQQALSTKFGTGIKVVTATYCSSDCKNSLYGNSLYYRTSRDQPYKLLYKLMSSALFRKIWCVYLHPVRSYWHFFISHNLKIQNGGSRHLAFWGCEFDHSLQRVDSVKFEICTKFCSNNVIVTEIDALMLKTFIWWRHGN